MKSAFQHYDSTQHVLNQHQNKTNTYHEHSQQEFYKSQQYIQHTDGPLANVSPALFTFMHIYTDQEAKMMSLR